MKKILILLTAIFIFSAISYAETGTEAIKACIDAMKFEKLDSFQTFKIETSLYQQNQKISVKFYSRDSTALRIEQSFMGKDEAYVILPDEEEIFKVVPMYEELDYDENVMQFFSLYNMVLPFASITEIIKNDTALDIELLPNEKFNGKDCKKIAISNKEDTTSKQNIYLDAATNWLVGMSVAEGVDFWLSGMKKVKGLVYPKSIKIMANGNKQAELEINNFEADIELDATLFSKPN